MTVAGPRELTPQIGRAAAANAAGAAVYVRVYGTSVDTEARHAGVVMLDDLSIDAVAQLAFDGLAACAVVETSPKNFQAWVRIAGAGEMSRQDAVAAARELANRYGGDHRAVGATQTGRLPGFTNRKAKYRLPTVVSRSELRFRAL